MTSAAGPEGILLVDKPAGWTSHDAVAKLRRLTGQRRIGHTGTLDPMATGLLVVCLGRATRLVEYMAGHDKRYTGEITLGVSTDTDDAEGTVTAERPVPQFSDDDLADLARPFTGTILQRPPAYSAVKVAGKRAYAVARAGGAVELAERPVLVRVLRLNHVAPGKLGVDVDCGAGTYIRSLARDIGEAAGCGAHLSGLRRVRAGWFTIDRALTLDDVARLVDSGELGEALLPADEGIADLDAAILGIERAALLAHGNVLAHVVEPLRDAPRARIYSSDGSFVGVAEVTLGAGIRALKVFAGA
ncbi:MAG: tRNA pseudouridine(55) synthase TruB [Chloroflexi bacterium]|nr:tRNA pseudouridine(55) synthase TruB [Chloroflexota bacterium]